MKINVKKHLRFVLMLLALCPLFMANSCPDSAWESVKSLPDGYYGDYKVTEFYAWNGKKLAKTNFDREDSYIFGGRSIKVQHLWFGQSYSQVSIENEKYYITNKTIEIDSLNEVLGNLEQCKMVQYKCAGGFLTLPDERCGGFDYQASGVWGFPGVGQKDFDVLYSFSNTNTLTMTFTGQGSDTSRNFKLVCQKKS